MSKHEFIISSSSARYFTEMSSAGLLDAHLCLEICNCTNITLFLKLIKSIYSINCENTGKIWNSIIHNHCFSDVRVKDKSNLNAYQIRFIKMLLENGGAFLKSDAFGKVLYNNNLLEKHSSILECILVNKSCKYDGFVKYIKLNKGWQVLYILDVEFYKEVVNGL